MIQTRFPVYIQGDHTGKRMFRNNNNNITGDARESNFLFQQLSVALQRGNAVSFQNMFTTS